MPVVFAGYLLISSRSNYWGLAWLTLASILFYAYWSLYSLPILIGSVLINYFIGIFLASQNTYYRKSVLTLAIIANIMVLGYFKYANFFIENFNIIQHQLGAQETQFLSIALPIGISFFTFTQIAFLVDSYQGKVEERSFLKYMLFVSFFPHLIAGPILHHKQMMSQLVDGNKLKANIQNISSGVAIFTIGLAKKLLLADPLGGYANILFDGVNAGFTPHLTESWVGSISYTFQLYFDFSGYSDMAVGLALLFGIVMPFNFNSPLKATSIIEFWKRWHISLTKYINEYLYTPITLKFMRLGLGASPLLDLTSSLIIPTILVMLIVGFWHGSNWTFIIFGGMHGIFLVINHLWRKRKFLVRNKKNSPSIYMLIACWSLTFSCVVLAFVMFRANQLWQAFAIYKGMLGFNGIHVDQSYSDDLILGLIKSTWHNHLSLGQTAGQSYGLILFSLFIVTYLPNTCKIVNQGNNNFLFRQPLVGGTFLGMLFVISILQLGKSSPFLYFQF